MLAKPFQHNIHNKSRFLVLYLDAKMKATRISEVIGVSLRTIQDWIHKTDNGIDVRKIQPGRARKASKSPSLQKNVLRKVHRAPLKSSTRKLAIQYDSSKSWIREVLKNKGLKYSSTKITHKLTKFEKEDRVEYCKEMLNKNGKRIYETVFTDEMGIWLSDACPKKAWGIPAKKSRSKSLLKT